MNVNRSASPVRVADFRLLPHGCCTVRSGRKADVPGFALVAGGNAYTASRCVSHVVHHNKTGPLKTALGQSRRFHDVGNMSAHTPIAATQRTCRHFRSRANERHTRRSKTPPLTPGAVLAGQAASLSQWKYLLRRLTERRSQTDTEAARLLLKFRHT
jgi:hypothetical protein